LPGPFSGDNEFDRYRNALHETDAALGQIITALDRLHELDRTMFVVFGDHGEAFGQHDGQIGHTLAVWDENVRVPLVIAVPGQSCARRIAAPASVLDVTPTVLDLIGLPWPANIEGASLLQPGPRLAPFFADYSTEWLGLRDGCWKYQLDRDADRSLLFDVCVDPRERHDLSAREPTRVAAYRHRLHAWRR
jgi:arylsulfatase A-like enzyme